jgi:hypothetical protein
LRPAALRMASFTFTTGTFDSGIGLGRCAACAESSYDAMSNVERSPLPGECEYANARRAAWRERA